MTSPTQRTRARLKQMGYASGIVEKFVRFPPPGHRVDLFGFIDIIALGNGETLAIQTTTTGTAARQQKIMECEALPEILRSGWTVETWGWRKVSGRKIGGRKLWQLRRMRLQHGSWVEVGEPSLSDEIPTEQEVETL